MANDITQRMMDAEAAANDDIGQKSFQHTTAFRQLTNSDPGTVVGSTASSMSGSELHDMLLERARAAKNAPPPSRRVVGTYAESLIGIQGNQQDSSQSKLRSKDGKFATTREYMKKREENKMREKYISPSERREKFNNTKSQDNIDDHKSPTRPSQKNSSDGQLSSHRFLDSMIFREPGSRGYDPYR